MATTAHVVGADKATAQAVGRPVRLIGSCKHWLGSTPRAAGSPRLAFHAYAKEKGAPGKRRRPFDNETNY